MLMGGVTRPPPSPGYDMRELRDQLQNSLGSHYVIERELGGGGMSRVFVARETALGRTVVVKVLPPGLTGVNAERFHREILLSARLQHPHIVPVHSAGEMNGTPYYTMPFIEGESLRDRIAREGALALPDAMHILRDVIDALAYAHEHGVIHRDIKPDNIILSRGHALVLDFGVAKALHAANAGPGDDGTTTAGIAIGTPAYMAPEQAAGDPTIDHRSDIYALGILAYETLTGVSPFAGRAPAEMMAANLTERPRDVRELRPEIPASLAALVSRCLEKRPNDRPASAAEIRHEIDAVITPAGSVIGTPPETPVPAAPRRRLPGRWIAASAAVVLLVAAAFATLAPESGDALDEELVAVMPFRISSPDPTLRYLSEGMLDLLAAKFDGDGGPRSADPRTIFSAWRRSGGTELGELARDRALNIAENVGAGRMLIGSVTGVSERIVLNATLIRVRDGRAEVQASVEGHADSLPRLVDNLTAQLLAAHAGERERIETLTSTSLPALRSYLSGRSLYRRGHYAEAAGEFNRALEIDSTFALAALSLARAASWFGDPSFIRRGLALAHQHRERLGPADRALLTAVAGPNYPAASTLLEVHNARLRFRDIAPDRAEAWFEVGDSYFHSGHTIGVADAHERAAEAFRRAIALDSSLIPAMEHLVLLAARAGDTVETRRVGELYLALDSLSEGASGVRWRMAVALGRHEELGELVRSPERMSPPSAYQVTMISQLDGLDMGVADVFASMSVAQASDVPLQRAAAMTAHDLALNRGRPDEALAYSAQLAEVEASPRQHLRERVRAALYWDGDPVAGDRAVRELLPSLTAPLPENRPERYARLADICIVEQWKLSSRDSSTIRRSIATLRDSQDEGDLPLGPNCAILLEAMYLAPRRDDASDAARARLERTVAAGPGGLIQEIGNLVVARLHEERGDLAAARAALIRREYFLGRTVLLSSYVREQARLAEMAGDRAAAAEAYRHYLALRSNPEPHLRGDIAWAREGLRRVERGD